MVSPKYFVILDTPTKSVRAPEFPSDFDTLYAAQQAVSGLRSDHPDFTYRVIRVDFPQED